MSLTIDPQDERLDNIEASGMQEAYLILSAEERAKGFLRPIRQSYVHVGLPKPLNPLRDLTKDEHKRYDEYGYVKYEKYDESRGVGRFWTQPQLDKIDNGCGHTTTMGEALAETYARDPKFYGATFCSSCGNHYPVGEYGEFIWKDTNERVGT